MKGFISYAHADHGAYKDFCKVLEPAAKHFGIEFWSDPKLHTGQDWNQGIADAIAAADVFLALVSVESLWSDYIRNKELPAMRGRSAVNGALIMPVVLNQCLWEYEFSATQAAPTDRGRLVPVVKWKPRPDGYYHAARQVADAIKRYYFSTPKGTP